MTSPSDDDSIVVPAEAERVLVLRPEDMTIVVPAEWREIEVQADGSARK